MDPVGWVMAVTGLIAAISGIMLSRRAQRDKDSQEKVALRIASDKAKLDSTQQALDAYERLVDTLQEEISRLQKANERVSEALTTERKHTREINASHNEVTERYRHALMGLLQFMLKLKEHSGVEDSADLSQAMTEAAEIMKPPS
jgi:uncharacterized membrane-anchored protein YhcB (DUF1043 family)